MDGWIDGWCIIHAHTHRMSDLYDNEGKGKVKGKVVPALLVTEHHTMKAYWGGGRTYIYTHS